MNIISEAAVPKKGNAKVGKKIFAALALCAFVLLISPATSINSSVLDAQLELSILRQAYSDIDFDSNFDSAIGDWRVEVTNNKRTTVLYRAEGRYLPLPQLNQKNQFRPLVYHYPDSPLDPATFDQGTINQLKKMGEAASRKTSPAAPSMLFDSIYDSASQLAVEQHIVSLTFLGKRVNVHERIEAPLMRVDAAIKLLAKNDADVKQFINTLATTDGYSWRQIRDTASRSFHSMGLAVDVLPKNWQNTSIYWNWEKNKGNAAWMLIPLAQRWAPPDKVIDAFENEGFIWGGKWPIWDNMHFEYRPELMLAKSAS